MNRQTPTSHESGCMCTDCTSGKRNRFFRGKNMKAGEFQLEQSYAIEKRRLLARAIAGWGVVYGLTLEGPRSSEPDAAALKVRRGMALDRHGRDAMVVSSVPVGSDNTFLIEHGAAGCQVRSIESLIPGKYVLAIHYAERTVGDAVLADDCGCANPERNFVCETVVFSLVRVCEDECPCGEPPCPRCRCCAHGCCPEKGRGPHGCLCHWGAEVKIPDGPGKLCLWRGWSIDPEDGVDLACIQIAEVGDSCTPAVCGWVLDECTPRRIVKRNDLLYDLVRGCDLTRIKCVSWGEWHRLAPPVPWHSFVDKLSAPKDGEEDHPTGFSVTFTGPVQTATVTPDCFSLTFVVDGEDTGWSERREVLITRVITSPTEWDDPVDTTRNATLCVDSDWYEEVTSHGSKFKKGGATVRIEVNGDYILDCHGQAVDANARGFALRDTDDGSPVAPSGNSTPGGTLVSMFRIEGRPAMGKPQYGQHAMEIK